MSRANRGPFRVRQRSGENREREEESKGVGRMAGKVAAGGGNRRIAGTMQEGKRQVVQGSHDLGTLTGAQAGGILSEGDITDIVAAQQAPFVCGGCRHAAG